MLAFTIQNVAFMNEQGSTAALHQQHVRLKEQNEQRNSVSFHIMMNDAIV